MRNTAPKLHYALLSLIYPFWISTTHPLMSHKCCPTWWAERRPSHFLDVLLRCTSLPLLGNDWVRSPRSHGLRQICGHLPPSSLHSHYEPKHLCPVGSISWASSFLSSTVINVFHLEFTLLWAQCPGSLLLWGSFHSRAGLHWHLIYRDGCFVFTVVVYSFLFSSLLFPTPECFWRFSGCTVSPLEGTRLSPPVLPIWQWWPYSMELVSSCMRLIKDLQGWGQDHRLFYTVITLSPTMIIA